MHRSFTLQTTGPGLTEITPDIAAWVAVEAPAEALLTLFVRHTSASLLIQENADPSVQTDLLAWLDRLVPPADHPSQAFLTHRLEGADDMPAHIKSALLPTSLQSPVISGQLALGVWQGIYLFEHRRRPHQRELLALLR